MGNAPTQGSCNICGAWVTALGFMVIQSNVSAVSDSDVGDQQMLITFLFFLSVSLLFVSSPHVKRDSFF